MFGMAGIIGIMPEDFELVHQDILLVAAPTNLSFEAHWMMAIKDVSTSKTAYHSSSHPVA